jgi:hypothetical protein
MQSLVTLKAVLDRIDGDSFESLEGRITFQKRVYLVQALGLDLGYRFSWNQYGPYSSELAQDALLLEAGLGDKAGLKEELRFTSTAERRISAFTDLAQPPAGISQAAWLELLSSLHYLATSSGLSALPEDKAARKEINDRLLSTKPYLEGHEDLLDQGWDRLEHAIRGSLAAA